MHIWDRETLDGRFQVPKALLGDDGGDLGGGPAGTVGLLYHHQPSRFRYRGEYGLFIQRYQRPWSMTSTLTPSLVSISAAVSASCTREATATTVTSVPARLTSAMPKGIRYSSSGTSPSYPRASHPRS